MNGYGVSVARPGRFGWLFRIRTRLLLVNVLIVAVPLAGVGFARFYEREMLRSLEHDMVHQAELVRRFLAADPSGLRLAERGPLLADAARETRTRIRLLGRDGALLADSHADGPPEGPEEAVPSLVGDVREAAVRARSLSLPAPAHPAGSASAGAAPVQAVDVSKRPEVLAALAGRYGATARFWQDRGTLYLFSALPIVVEGRTEGVVYVTRSTNPVRAAMYRLRTTLFWVLLAALGATVVLSLFLAGTISRPLARLMRIAERIAAGDRTQTLKLARRDEIGQLARTFDAMERRLDERTRAVARLAADISHEFKSPLAGLRGAAELLIDGAADDPVARERFLRNILADANRLDRLVTRLLELSRVEADHAPFELFDYEALVREACCRAQGPAQVELQYLSKRAHIVGRRAHLASVLRNLLDNAEQHADPASRIDVAVFDAPGGGLSTSVRNRGPVIKEANLARIWDRFFTTRADCGGTGLGLPIVHAAVAAHGGTVRVCSGEGEGTTFTFDLPALDVSVAQRPASP